MLRTCEDLKPLAGVLKGTFDAAGWGDLPAAPVIRQLRVLLGDETKGPLVWLMNAGRFELPEGEERPEYLSVHRHRHRSVTFRSCVGEDPHQIMLDRQWCGFGDYFLLEANRPYFDPVSPDGYRSFLVFADRRGYPPIREEYHGLSSDDLLAARVPIEGPFGDTIRVVHEADDEATMGAAFSAKQMRHGRAKGSIDDQDDWVTLSDGSRLAVALLGDTSDSPMVFLSQNAPNSRESPGGTYDADTFRLFLRGTCAIGEHLYRSGEFVATEAGTPQGEIVHGHDGSFSFILFAEQSGWRLQRGTDDETCEQRDDEIASLVATMSKHSV